LKILNLATLQKFGNKSEKRRAAEDLENLHLSEMNVAQIIPLSMKSPLTSTDAETALQTFKNVIEEHSCVSDDTSIPHHPKLTIDSENDDEEEQRLQCVPSPFENGQSCSKTTINNSLPTTPAVDIIVQCPLNLK
jgi:hypothetical protein